MLGSDLSNEDAPVHGGALRSAQRSGTASGLRQSVTLASTASAVAVAATPNDAMPIRGEITAGIGLPLLVSRWAVTWMHAILGGPLGAASYESAQTGNSTF